MILPIPALIKPVLELTALDLQGLIDSEIQESENVEFKQDLTPSKGTDSISDRAKRSIVKEVVALANSFGGRIFLGIAESDDEPPKADRITAISDCAEIAGRFEQIIGDLIDPPLLRVHIEGVSTDEDGSGVVVFDVYRSMQSPHRSKSDKQCYRRRGSESVPMDMREIQDMTLRSGSRFSDIEARFVAQKLEFEQLVEQFKNRHSFGFCLRMTFVPMDVVDLGKVHGNQEVTPEFRHLEGRFNNLPRDAFWFRSPWSMYGNSGPIFSYESRPILRGTKATYGSPGSLTRGQISVSSNGELNATVATGSASDNYALTSDFLLGWLANGLRNVERIRRYAGNPVLDYGLEAQIVVFGCDLVLRGFRELYHAPLPSEVLEFGNHDKFPRYSIGTLDEFDTLVNIFITDWFNNAGVDWYNNEIMVDYQLPS